MVAQVPELLGGELAKPLHEWLKDVGRRLDERASAASAPSNDEALFPQDGQRLSQRDCRDAELLGELCLGRKLFTVEDESEPDRLAQSTLDHVHSSGRVRGRREDSSRGNRREADMRRSAYCC